MLAAVIEDFGRVVVRETDEPAIAAPNDVIVRLAAAGVCRTDLETIRGGLVPAYGPPAFPYIAGHENAGHVMAVGTSVTTVSPGDAVLLHPYATCGLCTACREGYDTFCTNTRFPGVDAKNNGGFAELMRTNERAVIKVAADTDLVALSPYADAGITAYHAVKRVRDFINPETHVVVLGIGGVGIFGVQLLKLMTPAIVTAVVTTEDKKTLALELGADHVVTGGLDNAVDAVREITDGGAGIVMDYVGSATSPSVSFKMLRRGGVYSVIGASGQIQVDALRTIVQEYTVIGNLVGTYRELEELLKLQPQLVSPHVTYPLADALQAIDDLDQGKITGRAVLVPAAG